MQLSPDFVVSDLRDDNPGAGGGQVAEPGATPVRVSFATRLAGQAERTCVEDDKPGRGQ